MHIDKIIVHIEVADPEIATAVRRCMTDLRIGENHAGWLLLRLGCAVDRAHLNGSTVTISAEQGVNPLAPLRPSW